MSNILKEGYNKVLNKIAFNEAEIKYYSEVLNNRKAVAEQLSFELEAYKNKLFSTEWLSINDIERDKTRLQEKEKSYLIFIEQNTKSARHQVL